MFETLQSALDWSTLKKLIWFARIFANNQDSDDVVGTAIVGTSKTA